MILFSTAVFKGTFLQFLFIFRVTEDLKARQESLVPLGHKVTPARGATKEIG